MKIRDVRLSILRTELDETVIPTHGAVDKLPEQVLVSVSTHEGIDGNYISYLIPTKAAEHAAEVARTILLGRDTFDVAALSREMTNALPPIPIRPPLPEPTPACGTSTPKLPACRYTNTFAPTAIRSGPMPAPSPTPPSTGTSRPSGPLSRRVSPRRNFTPFATPRKTSNSRRRSGTSSPTST
jgi:hypothetical protein